MFPCEDSVGLEDLKLRGECKQRLKAPKDSSKKLDSQEVLSADVSEQKEETDNSKPDDIVIGRKRCSDQTVQNENLNDSPTKKTKPGFKIPFEKVILIDSTWNQTRNIANDERLKSELLCSD